MEMKELAFGPRRKGMLLTLLTVIMFVFMLGELLVYAIVSMNLSTVSSGAAVASAAGTFMQKTNSGIYNYLQSSTEEAMQAYYTEGCTGNITATVKSLIVNGTTNNGCRVTINPTAAARLTDYTSVLKAYAAQQQMNLSITNQNLDVYQYSPNGLVAVYTALAVLNASTGGISYGIDVRMEMPISGTP